MEILSKSWISFFLSLKNRSTAGMQKMSEKQTQAHRNMTIVTYKYHVLCYASSRITTLRFVKARRLLSNWTEYSACESPLFTLFIYNFVHLLILIPFVCTKWKRTCHAHGSIRLDLFDSVFSICLSYFICESMQNTQFAVKSATVFGQKVSHTKCTI